MTVADEKAVKDLRAAAKRLLARGLIEGSRHYLGRSCALGAFEQPYQDTTAERDAPEALVVLANFLRKNDEHYRKVIHNPSVIAQWSNVIARKTTPSDGAEKVAKVFEKVATQLERGTDETRHRQSD